MSDIPLRGPSLPLRGPPDHVAEPRKKNRGNPYRLAWACLPVMLALSAATLLVFGASWWTVLIVLLLLACPASIAMAIYVSEHP